MKKKLMMLLLFNVSMYAQCWMSVSSGADFCAALKDDGTLWCWGNNEGGQLGIGSFENQIAPVQVGADNDWASASAGYGFVVALKTDGTLWVWGRNDFGLGAASGNMVNVPEQVGTDTDWKTVAAGGAHSLAIKEGGTLWGWGRNDFGQLGNSSNIHSNVPVQVGNADDWDVICAGIFHSLALKTDHTLWSWGYNFAGQLGQGTVGFGTELNVPTQVAATVSAPWQSIAAGGRHSVGITGDGVLWVWGSNTSSALGINDGSTYKSVPTILSSTIGWSAAFGGLNQTFALKEDGSLWAWGINTDGQLGDGTFINRSTPVQIETATGEVFAGSGERHGVVLVGDVISTAGSNNYGQLGSNTQSPSSISTLQTVACPVLRNLANEENGIIVFPNPATDYISLQHPDGFDNGKLDIYDDKGVLVMHVDDLANPVSTACLQAGVYILRLTCGERQRSSKLVKL